MDSFFFSIFLLVFILNKFMWQYLEVIIVIRIKMSIYCGLDKFENIESFQHLCNIMSNFSLIM